MSSGREMNNEIETHQRNINKAFIKISYKKLS